MNKRQSKELLKKGIIYNGRFINHKLIALKVKGSGFRTMLMVTRELRKLKL